MGECTEELQDTELHDAVRYGNLDEVIVALERGLDSNQIGMYEWTPLHEAACNGDLEILKRLLEYRGNPNKPDLLKGFSAIHYAAKNGHEECLKQLLQHGGRFDVLSNSRESCFDVATKECLKILQLQRAKDVIDSSDNESDKRNGNSEDEENRNLPPEKMFVNIDKSLDDDDDEDDIILKEPSKVSPRGTWVRDLGQNVDQGPIAGHAQLSFEYNSKKSTLKIRVWQVSEILLPPVETSMFSAIYVKSYLQPDGKHQTKRRSEEIKLDNPELPVTKAHYKSMSHDREVSLHAVFQPMTFKFSKPLEYNKVTNEMVRERTVEIVVCVIQKYTRKSFMIAKLLIPLKDAVRKLLREKFVLRPCLQTNDLEKVRPYPMEVLKVVSNYRLFGGSNPNVRVSPVFVSEEGRSSSDSNLKDVAVGSASDAVVLSLPMEDPSDGDSLQSVSIEELRSESVCSVSMGEERSDSGFETSPRDSSFSISPQPKSDVSHLKLERFDMAGAEKVKNSDSCANVSDIEGGKGSKVKDTSSLAEDGHMTSFDTVVESFRGLESVAQNTWVTPGSSRSESPASFLTSSSRPDTPTWDSYMQPLEITGVIPMDAPEEVYHPPMATSMNLPGNQQSFRPMNLQSNIPTLPGQTDVHLENENASILKKLPRMQFAAAAEPKDARRQASKRSVPVMGSKAWVSTPGPGDEKVTPLFELKYAGHDSNKVAHPGKVLRVQSGIECETSFSKEEVGHPKAGAEGKGLPQMNESHSGQDSMVSETSFNSSVVNCGKFKSKDVVGRNMAPITQLKTSKRSSVTEAQKPLNSKTKYEFGKVEVTITELKDAFQQDKRGDLNVAEMRHPVAGKGLDNSVSVVELETDAAAVSSLAFNEKAAMKLRNMTKRSRSPAGVREISQRSKGQNQNMGSTNSTNHNLTSQGHKESDFLNQNDQKSTSPSSSKAVSPINKAFLSVSQRVLNPTNQRAMIPTNQGGLSSANQRALGSADQRASSPTNQRALSPTNQRALSSTNQRALSPSNENTHKLSPATEIRPLNPSARPTSPSVDAAKERLKQKLLIKKQRMQKQREHELLLFDSGPRPGKVEVVNTGADLESDV